MDKNIQIEVHSADLIVVGGTPAGIMAGIAAAENGLSVIILERSHHVGGLPANGLGATDISTRGLAAGLFRDFTNRIRDYYEKTYGIDSEQYKTCSSGYHFEPSVAENILNTMLSEHPGITLLLERQLDPGSASVDVQNGVIASLKVHTLWMPLTREI
jgi:2-polyprenyl-6-methoxyphenol hydroxylase-like FAD-dependent oxidoreductase